eukprot:366426-Chlamydomonas_euryale.AAC.21
MHSFGRRINVSGLCWADPIEASNVMPRGRPVEATLTCCHCCRAAVPASATITEVMDIEENIWAPKYV